MRIGNHGVMPHHIYCCTLSHARHFPMNKQTKYSILFNNNNKIMLVLDWFFFSFHHLKNEYLVNDMVDFAENFSFSISGRLYIWCVGWESTVIKRDYRRLLLHVQSDPERSEQFMKWCMKMALFIYIYFIRFAIVYYIPFGKELFQSSQLTVDCMRTCGKYRLDWWLVHVCGAEWIYSFSPINIMQHSYVWDII